MKARRASILFLSLFVLGIVLLATSGLVHALPAGFQEFYLPLPTGDNRASPPFNGTYSIFNAIEPPITAGRGMHYVVGVTASSDNTAVYYDHWENGLGTGPSGDEVVYLSKGQVHYFESASIPVPRGTNTYYDGGDRIFVSGSLLQLVVSTWTEHQGTVFSDAWEIYPRQAWEAAYTIPVGQDLAASPRNYRDFTYVYAVIMSGSDNNAIQIRNAAGTLLASTTLNRGKTYIYQVLTAGTTVSGSAPVQVQLMTGRRDTSGWEMRGYTMMPQSFWGNSYWAPVPSWRNSNTDIFLYNPNTAAITVSFEDRTGSGSFTIPPRQTINYRTGAGRYVPQNSGVHLSSTSTFWGIISGDTGSATWDWGCSLIPENFLGTDNYLSWAPGTSNLTGNGSPVFVTALVDGTKVFVDYSPSDGTFDDVFSLNKLQVVPIYAPGNNNTGMHLVSTQPVSIAWGENPDRAASGNPYLDMGYTTLPLPTEWIDLALEVTKSASPESIELGDNATFTIVVAVPSTAGNPVTGINPVDSLPPGWVYVTGSSNVGEPVISGELASGYQLTWNVNWTISPGASQTITFKGQAVSADTLNPNRDVATATGTALGATLTADDDAFVRVVQLGPAVIEAEKTATLYSDVNGDGDVNPGDILRYVITIRNTGQSDASSVVLSDTPDGNTALIVGSVELCQCPGCTVTGGNTAGDTAVGVDIGTLVSGTSVQICFLVRISGNEGFSSVINQGEVSSDVVPVYPSVATLVVIPPPVLTISKEAPPEVVVDPSGSGTIIQYTGTLTNTSTTPAHNVVLVDQLPPGVTFISSSHGAVYDDVNNRVTWDLGTVGPGVAIPGWLTVRVPTGLPDGTLLTNRFSLTWQDLGGTSYGPAEATAATVAYNHPRLSIEKTGPETAINGQQFSYTVTLRNIGDSIATHAALTDTLPSGLTYVNSSPVGTHNAGPPATVTWSDLGSIEPGGTKTVSITVTVTGSLPNGTLLTDTARATWKDSLNNPYGPITATAGTTVYTSPLLTMTKTAPAEAEVGSVITYTGTLSNVGGSAATDVILVDQLPYGVTFVSSSNNAVYNIESNTVTWYLGTIPAGASVPGWLTVRIADTLADATLLTNQFTVTGKDGAGNPVPEATAAADTTARSRPLLAVEKTGPAQAYHGETISYTLTVTNYSGTEAVNVVLMDNLPIGLTYVSSNPMGTEVMPGVVSWGLGNIQPNGSRTVTVSATVDGTIPNATPLEDIASVSWQNAAGQNFGPVAATAHTVIHTLPQLQITKFAPAEAQVGTTLTYTGTLTNVGGSTASNVVLVDQLPQGVTFVSSSHSAVYDPVANTVTWQLGSIGPGASVPGWLTVSIAETIPDGSSLTNTFTARGTDPFGASVPDATASVNTTVRTHPVLILEKSGPATSFPGQDVTYTIAVTNTGGTPASNVVLMDSLPLGLTYQSSNPAGVYASGILTWNVGVVDPGKTLTFQITARVDSGIENNSHLVDTAMATWKDPLGQDHGPVTTQAATEIFTLPQVTIVKSGPASSYASATFAFTLQVCNVGGTDAQNVIVQDNLPAGLNYVSSNPSGTYSDRTITWSLLTLAAGACTNLTLTVQVAAGTPETTLVNIAGATWNDLLGAAGPQSTSSSIIIKAGPSLTVTKSGPDQAMIGSNMTYSNEVCNAGGTAAENVSVIDMVPLGFEFVSANLGGTYNPSSGMVTWSLASLAPESCQTFTVTLRAACSLPPGSALVNTAMIGWQGPGGAPDYGPVFATKQTQLDRQVLLSKVGSPRQVAPGADITYTITLKNIGTTPLTNVVVRETYDANVSFLNATPSPDTGTNNRWTISSLGAGATRTIVITVRVKQAVGNGKIIQNRVTSSFNQLACTLENTATAQSTVRSSASVPALSGWGLIILFLLLSVAGVVRMKMLRRPGLRP